MSWSEVPFFFDGAGERLFGICAVPAVVQEIGVIVVVGGPQCRIGSHRQFTLLARQLAAHGFASLRFDYRGMGDSSGSMTSFEDLNTDIRAAVDALIATAPGVRKVVLWGLCDGATAAAFYAPTDSRVTGVVLLNPWIRTETGEAQARLRGYYARRMGDRAFWRRLARGEVRFGSALRSLVATLVSAVRPSHNSGLDKTTPSGSLPLRFAEAVRLFDGALLIILSGRDMVADEFKLLAGGPVWQRTIADKRIAQKELQEATHTFATSHWREQVEQWTVEWLRQLSESDAERVSRH